MAINKKQQIRGIRILLTVFYGFLLSSILFRYLVHGIIDTIRSPRNPYAISLIVIGGVILISIALAIYATWSVLRLRVADATFCRLGSIIPPLCWFQALFWSLSLFLRWCSAFYASWKQRLIVPVLKRSFEVIHLVWMKDRARWSWRRTWDHRIAMLLLKMWPAWSSNWSRFCLLFLEHLFSFVTWKRNTVLWQHVNLLQLRKHT